MKRIKELGISPWPWEDGYGHYVASLGEVGERLCVASDVRSRDLKLIAAAPELYECLTQAVSFIADNSEHIGADCDTASFVAKCRAALAKAAGEEVSNG